MKKTVTQKDIDYMLSPKGILEALEHSLEDMEDPIKREQKVKEWELFLDKKLTAEEIKKELQDLIDKRKSDK